METEQRMDEYLRIKTGGRDETCADAWHHPYEPTPYSVLERLAQSGLVGKEDMLLDYGCGKGRVGFFLSHRVQAKTLGIEYDERIYNIALENQKTALSKEKTAFVLARAEKYTLSPQVSGCYFFNPFSAEILRKVLSRILESYYENPREIFLFFYYPSDEFIACLMTLEELDFYDEIDCRDLFEGADPRERILIFRLP